MPGPDSDNEFNKLMQQAYIEEEKAKIIADSVPYDEQLKNIEVKDNVIPLFADPYSLFPTAMLDVASQKVTQCSGDCVTCPLMCSNGCIGKTESKNESVGFAPGIGSYGDSTAPYQSMTLTEEAMKVPPFKIQPISPEIFEDEPGPELPEAWEEAIEDNMLLIEAFLAGLVSIESITKVLSLEQAIATNFIEVPEEKKKKEEPPKTKPHQFLDI